MSPAKAISIGQPYATSERGGRPNNEDSIHPLQPSTGERLFLVCDGVGGAAKGEVASRLATEAMAEYFAAHLPQPGAAPTPDFVREAVGYVERSFDRHLADSPDASGMATTLTLAYIGHEAITIAHIGDSRVYLIRQGEIVHRTEDHSLVASLVRSGALKAEDARCHPRRNVILRAIQGSAKPAEPEVTVLTDLQPGDCLLLCTDGLLEAFDDQALAAVFEESTPQMAHVALTEACRAASRDNFSFYLIPILSA